MCTHSQLIDIAPGDYLLRIEHIGLHGAGESGGAQFYPSCAQVTVEGSGSGTPAPTASFPGAYSADDPGILINIYWPIVSYSTPRKTIVRKLTQS